MGTDLPCGGTGHLGKGSRGIILEMDQVGGMDDGVCENAVIGVGNPLMGDDGAGPAVLARLRELRGDLEERVAIVDGGTGGLALMYLLEHYKRAIIVDCADFDAAPGKVRVVALDEMRSIKSLQRYSLHEADLVEVLTIASKLGSLPDELRLILVQPAAVAMGESLSPAVMDAVDVAAERVQEELERMLG